MRSLLSMLLLSVGLGQGCGFRPLSSQNLSYQLASVQGASTEPGLRGAVEAAWSLTLRQSSLAAGGQPLEIRMTQVEVREEATSWSPQGARVQALTARLRLEAVDPRDQRCLWRAEAVVPFRVVEDPAQARQLRALAFQQAAREATQRLIDGLLVVGRGVAGCP